MKRIIVFLLAILPMAFVLSTAEAKPNKQKVVLYVYLHCQDCCDKIMKNIPFDKDLNRGVKDIEFDMEAQTVTVTYDANKTNVPALQKQSHIQSAVYRFLRCSHQPWLLSLLNHRR